MDGAGGMNDEKRQNEPPLFLDLDFGEALMRFTRTDPKQVVESIERAKQRKEPGDKAARPRPRKDGA